MYKFNLFTLKKQLEIKEGRDVSWSEIAEGAGVARSTLYRIATNESSRVDLETLSSLIKYFKNKGLDVEIGNLFRLEPAA